MLKHTNIILLCIILIIITIIIIRDDISNKTTINKLTIKYFISARMVNGNITRSATETKGNVAKIKQK